MLALSGGIILFLVALKNVLAQFEPPTAARRPLESRRAAAMKVAVTPLAFPTIVTPYGIAALVVLIAMSPTGEDDGWSGVSSSRSCWPIW